MKEERDDAYADGKIERAFSKPKIGVPTQKIALRKSPICTICEIEEKGKLSVF